MRTPGATQEDATKTAFIPTFTGEPWEKWGVGTLAHFTPTYQGTRTWGLIVPGVEQGYRSVRRLKDLDTGSTLSDCIRVEEHEHTLPEILESRSQVDVRPFLNDQSC